MNTNITTLLIVYVAMFPEGKFCLMFLEQFPDFHMETMEKYRLLLQWFFHKRLGDMSKLFPY